MLLAFADHLLIVATSKKQLKEKQPIIKELVKQLGKVGLELNYDKCQLLLRFPNNRGQLPNDIILISGPFKVCDSIKYLGVCLTAT